MPITPSGVFAPCGDGVHEAGNLLLRTEVDMRAGWIVALGWLLGGVGLALAQEAGQAPGSEPQRAQAAEAAPAEPGLLPPPWATPFLAAEHWVDGVLHGPRGPLMVDVEFLWWFQNNGRSPPRLFASSRPNNDNEQFGQAGLDYQSFLGPRFTVDYWLDPTRCWGLNFGLFFLGENAIDFPAREAPILARTFFNINDQRDSAFIVCFPGLAAGSLDASTTSQPWGFDMNVWKNCLQESIQRWVRVDALFGLRYVDLSEDFVVNSVTAFYDDLRRFPLYTQFAGNAIQATDVFITRNQFFGPQVGGSAKFFSEYVNVELRTKLALGSTNEQIKVNGYQIRRLTDGQTLIYPGGVLALVSNSGDFSREKLSIVAEENVIVTIPVGPHCAISAGYTMLYWGRTVRPADQIMKAVNVAQLPNYPEPFTPVGLPRPVVPFKETSWWIHGVTFGVEFTW